MERTIKIFNVNQISLIFFIMLVLVSMTLMLLKASEYRLVLGDSEAANFKVTLTPDYIVVENPYRNLIASYSISTSSSTASPKDVFIEVFPLKLPRMINTYNKTISLRTWDFNVYNALRINYTEIRGGDVLQKIYAVDLKFHLEELLYANSSLKIRLENIEMPHEHRVNENLFGLLEPLTGQLYGGFYIPSDESINIVLRWKPADKPIAVTVYHEEGKIENYLLTGGEWAGSLKAVDTGLNCLIIGNLDQNENITYSCTILNP